MTNSITSKTHRYISIRTVPSNYILEKFHNGDLDANIKMRDTYLVYFEFYKRFIEFATGHSYDSYYEDRYRDAMRVSIEVLHEVTGITIATVENHYIFCIPKTTDDSIYDYLLTCPSKYKALKKTNGTFTDFGVQTWCREMYIRDIKISEMVNKGKL